MLFRKSVEKLLLHEIFNFFPDFLVIKHRQVMTIDHSSSLAHDFYWKNTTVLAKMQILNVQVYFHYIENLLSAKVHYRKIRKFLASAKVYSREM